MLALGAGGVVAGGSQLRALDHPGDDVLEPAEDRPPLAAGLAEPESVVGCDRGAAPGAACVRPPAAAASIGTTIPNRQRPSRLGR